MGFLFFFAWHLILVILSGIGVFRNADLTARKRNHPSARGQKSLAEHRCEMSASLSAVEKNTCILMRCMVATSLQFRIDFWLVFLRHFDLTQ